MLSSWAVFHTKVILLQGHIPSADQRLIRCFQPGQGLIIHPQGELSRTKVTVVFYNKVISCKHFQFGAPYSACVVVSFLLPYTIGLRRLSPGGPCHWCRMPEMATALASVSNTNSPSESSCASAIASISAFLISLNAFCCSGPHVNVTFSPVTACRGRPAWRAKE